MKESELERKRKERERERERERDEKMSVRGGKKIMKFLLGQ